MRDPLPRRPALHHPGELIRGVVDTPEFNVALSAFLLNYPWEFLQAPLYRGMAEATHWEATKFCTRALGDAVIAVVAFWGVAAVARTRRWILRASFRQVAGFVAIALAATTLLEKWATQVSGGWAYSDAMPLVLGIGVTPLLQWSLVPMLVVWFVCRQLT